MDKPLPNSASGRRRRVWMLVVFVAWLSLPLHAQRRDVIVMKNGDRITGKIKRLEYGQLVVEVDYVAGEVIGLDWLQVEKLESTARWRVNLQDGTPLTGTIEKVPAEQAPGEDFRIEEAGSKASVSAPEVVEIQRQKRSFWRQLKGSVDMGQSYTSGNNEVQLNLDAAAKYFTPKYHVQTSFSTSVSGPREGERTRRFNGTLFFGRFLSHNNLLFGTADFLTSTQQSLDLRTTLGGGYGRYLVRSNRTNLAAFGGLVFTREQFDPSAGLEPKQQNVEGLLGLKYSTFRFNKAEFESSLQLYPGISDAGRFRATTSNSLTVKFAHDFHLRFNFWDNFDSNPPVNAKKNELGVSTTFGLSF